MSDTAVKHLRQAVADLKRERDEVDRQIDTIERVLRELDPSEVQATPATNGSVPVPAAPSITSRSIREIVLDIASAGEVFSLDDVVSTAHAEGNKAESASISSILSRLKKDEKIVAGPRRGTYRAAASSLAVGDTVSDEFMQRRADQQAHGVATDSEGDTS